MSESYFSISSDRLQVQIAHPGRIYRRTRFDWTGFITQVTLDGRHQFCTKESFQPDVGTGGEGICNEFGSIGYDECSSGQYFMKLGIGNLKRDQENYSFRRDYEMKPVQNHLEIRSDQAIFSTEPLECNGYSVKLNKIISVQGNELTIDYRLYNVGSKPVKTTEYCHNFLAINGTEVGPEYQLTLPYRAETDNLPEGLAINHNTLTWRDIPQKSFYCIIKGYSESDPHSWTLTHTQSGISVSEYTQAPVRFALWGLAHVVSPEIFVPIQVQPGESQNWKRKFEFNG